MPDHRDVMADLAVAHGWKRGVEVGVGRGMLFARLLALGVQMIGVDLGRRKDRRRIVQTLGGRMLWMGSTEAAGHVDDGWADFVFIDAGHSYIAVQTDIAAWAPKVREGGWLGGHDYHPSFPGVIRAVDEAFPDRVLLEGWIWARR